LRLESPWSQPDNPGALTNLLRLISITMPLSV
jgi:hypothetical protein